MFITEKNLPNSIETYIGKISKSTQLVYISTLITLTLLLISLPIIEVDISSQASGIVRPINEIVEIKAPVSEVVKEVLVSEGEYVKEGQLLLKFHDNALISEINYQKRELENISNQIHDLSTILSGKKTMLFYSDICRTQYQLFVTQKLEIEQQIEIKERDFERNKILYNKHHISDSEYEFSLSDLVSKKNELAAFIDHQRSEWYSKLNSLNIQKEEIISADSKSQRTLEQYEIHSPINGTLDQFRGIYPNSYLQAGQSIAVISPDTLVCIEAYVSSSDIGYLHIGQPVKIQLSSFDYRQWGVLQGKITEISSDSYHETSNNIYFKVKCSINKDYLVLQKTGMKGYIKKGMAAVVHFNINKKSIFDLLYQSFDEWINPTLYLTNMQPAKKS